jgi:hypothetical protein
MIGLAIPLLLVLLAVVLVVVIAIQRSMKKSEDKGSGGDLVSYLVLALAMGVAGFALAELASTAFPGDRFVFDPADNLATSLAALVVSAPFVVYFWRRQADRRVAYPGSAGWTLYLALIELVFLIAFVVSAVGFVDGLIGDGSASAWTGALVFGAIVSFHELAARQTPPLSDAGELQRVIGSAIGLVTAGIGLSLTLAALFDTAFEGLGLEFRPWLAMLLVGAPVWVYRWLRPWTAEPSVPRLTWAVVVSAGTLVAAIASASTIAVIGLQYVFADTPAAGQHFDTIPVALAVLIAALPIWAIHIRALGGHRSNPKRVYEYGVAAIGLAAAASGAIALTLVVFDRGLIVGGGARDVITFAVTLAVGLGVWRLFGGRWKRGDAGDEAEAWPRRIYNLGLGIIFGLVSAGALITTLFILLRRLLEGDATASLLTPITIFTYTGLATWYLLAAFARDRDVAGSEKVISPFEVTIITSHPGMIADRFPKQAKLQVIHRGDDAGPIDAEMAEAIVDAVDNKSSLVWVDETGFRIAPKRVD